eukprot:SAG22_NODE_2_length_61565_cov_858.782010_41_plen_62_part_00
MAWFSTTLRIGRLSKRFMFLCLLRKTKIPIWLGPEGTRVSKIETSGTIPFGKDPRKANKHP